MKKLLGILLALLISINCLGINTIKADDEHVHDYKFEKIEWKKDGEEHSALQNINVNIVMKKMLHQWK